jgi:hypothetical protein
VVFRKKSMLRIAIAALTIFTFAAPADAQTVRKKPAKCYKFDQSGRKLAYNCKTNPTMQEELAAQQQIKAQQPPKPTTQQCRMVSGQLVCN